MSSYVKSTVNFSLAFRWHVQQSLHKWLAGNVSGDTFGRETDTGLVYTMVGLIEKENLNHLSSFIIIFKQLISC